jgi:Lipocalin-like domain
MAHDTPVRPLSRDLILGSWRMTSWVTKDVATGERQDALGQNPRGTVVYTPQRVTFLITKNNRSPEQLPASSLQCRNPRHRHPRHFRIEPTDPVAAYDKVGGVENMSLNEIQHRPINLGSLRFH